MSDENAMMAEAEEAPAPDATPEASSPSADAEASGERDTGDHSSPDGDGTDADPKAERRQGRLDKRFGELTGEIHSLRGQLAAKEQETERMLQLLERGGTTEQAAGTQDSDPEPSRDGFEDFQDYLDARSRWVARQEFREQSSKHEKALAQRDAQAAAQAIEERWQRSHTAAIEQHGDEYVELFEAVGRSIDHQMAMDLKLSDDPAAVVFYLGKNPEALDKVRGLRGEHRLMEVGRIEGRLKSERRASAAPKPPTPVRGAGAGTSDPLSDKVPIDQWMKNRQAQVSKARGAR